MELLDPGLHSYAIFTQCFGRPFLCFSPPQPITEFGVGGASPGNTLGGLGTLSSLGGNNPHSVVSNSIRADPSLSLSQFDHHRLTDTLDASMNKMDDEHKLIARYAAKLAQETLNSLVSFIHQS